VSQPTVSVIVPVKNGERFLAEALDSVRAQTFRDWELIVVVGPSTDRSLDVAQSYPEARCLPQTSNGIPAAWNQGIAAARGRLLAFLSSDDRWSPDKLERQVARLDERPELMLCVCHFRYFRQRDCGLPPGFNPRLLERDLAGWIMETLLARREIFDLVGPFDPRFPIGEDVDWYARAKDLGVPAEALPDVLLHKRVHDHNTSCNAELNNPLLMRALRASIARKRAAGDQQSIAHSTA
jgi:glycosyltransferase involved in cell wall biosynthesis